MIAKPQGVLSRTRASALELSIMTGKPHIYREFDPVKRAWYWVAITRLMFTKKQRAKLKPFIDRLNQCPSFCYSNPQLQALAAGDSAAINQGS